jgi:hypothetical protein
MGGMAGVGVGVGQGAAARAPLMHVPLRPYPLGKPRGTAQGGVGL